ncbi:MAG: radical SAM protein [Oligoflexia bacterium]|nr:radical SAM protein [Oligoflexia bacterium]
MKNELSYKDFSAQINDKSFSNKIPTHGHFELTFKCAMACDFCYCSCYTSSEHTKREIKTDEAISILRKVIDDGCLWLTFSGGDPFIRKDFRKIYDYAYERGVIISIFCSGLIFTDEWIDHLVKTKPLKIEMPFYGTTEKTFDAVSGKPGAYKTYMKNLKKLLQSELPIKLKTKITKKNISEVFLIKQFIEKELQLEFHPNYFLYPKLDGTKEHLSHRLSPIEIEGLERSFSFEQCDSNSSAIAEPIDSEINDKLFNCAAGVNSFYINPYGEMNFCTYVREFNYNLLNGSLVEGIDNIATKLFSMKKEDTNCLSCNISSTCQNCPGHAVLETGSLKGKSDYLCEVNHRTWNLP